jgi:hypothetical protein
MVRVRVPALISLLVIAMAFPAAASAHRRATKAERAALVAAVVHQGKLSTTQAACQVATISTVNRGYAVLAWPAKLSKACLRVAANGVILEHRVSGHWDFLTEGSSLQCPIKGVPARVAHDLGVCG